MRSRSFFFFFFNDTATTEIYTLSLHDALPIYYQRIVSRTRPGPGDRHLVRIDGHDDGRRACPRRLVDRACVMRSEEHTSELQSRLHLVCRLLLEKKKKVDREVGEEDLHLERAR